MKNITAVIALLPLVLAALANGNITISDGMVLQQDSVCKLRGNAEIDGRSVIVCNEKITNPIAVRYGWAKYPFCNLYSKAGLPALPFRTDNFNIVEDKPR